MNLQNDVEQASEGYVTVVTGGQLFGLRLARVRDVFVPKGLSQVPLAPPEVAGVLNLRGRIVTAIDLRRRLGLPPRADGGIPVAVGIEERGRPAQASANGRFRSCRRVSSPSEARPEDRRRWRACLASPRRR